MSEQKDQSAYFTPDAEPPSPYEQFFEIQEDQQQEVEDASMLEDLPVDQISSSPPPLLRNASSVPFLDRPSPIALSRNESKEPGGGWLKRSESSVGSSSPKHSGGVVRREEVSISGVLDILRSEKYSNFLKDLRGDLSQVFGKDIKLKDFEQKIAMSIADLLDESANYTSFQELVKAMSVKDVGRRFKALSTAVNDFIGIAVRLSEIVISEISISERRKLLRSSDVGGIAGGMKFIAR
jgi:hypothetical protein